MNEKSIKKNYIYNTCYQILLLVTPLVVTPYISRVLGPDGIGTVSYAESIVSYFSLFASMGITTYGQREISYVQDNIEKRSIVFWNTKILSLCTSGTSLLAYVFYILFYSNSKVFIILALNIFSVLVDVTWFFQGMEDFKKVVSRNAVFKLLNISYIFIMVKNPDDILKYVFGTAFFLMVGNISLWRCLPQYISRLHLKDLHPFKDIKIVLSLFVPTIAIQIYTVLDKTMIGIITHDSFENGYYEQALKISRMLLMLVASLGTVMIPRIGYHFEKGDTEEVRRLMYRGYKFVWFLGIPLCLGLIMVSDNFVPWFLGDGYGRVSVLLKILAFLILAIGINNVTGIQYLIPTKRQGIFTITATIGACTNFILNVCLIPILYSAGAAIASVAAETFIAVVQLIIVKKELSGLKILKSGINYYLSGAVMAVLLLFEKSLLSPSILHTAFLVVSGAFVYFLMLLILKDEFFISNMKAVLAKIKH